MPHKFEWSLFPKVKRTQRRRANSVGTTMQKKQVADDQHGSRQFIDKSQVKTKKYYTVQSASILWSLKEMPQL